MSFRLSTLVKEEERGRGWGKLLDSAWSRTRLAPCSTPSHLIPAHPHSRQNKLIKFKLRYQDNCTNYLWCKIMKVMISTERLQFTFLRLSVAETTTRQSLNLIDFLLFINFSWLFILV